MHEGEYAELIDNLLSEGFKPYQIAEKLRVAPRKVKRIIRNMNRMLKCKTFFEYTARWPEREIREARAAKIWEYLTGEEPELYGWHGNELPKLELEDLLDLRYNTSQEIVHRRNGDESDYHLHSR